jgi:hypothetical protein
MAHEAAHAGVRLARMTCNDSLDMTAPAAGSAVFASFFTTENGAMDSTIFALTDRADLLFDRPTNSLSPAASRTPAFFSIAAQ